MRNEVPLLAEWGEAHPGDLAAAVAERRQRGLPVLDLITANPQQHGFEFPQDLLQSAIARGIAAGRHYAPDARGQEAARVAIARYHGAIGPGQIIVTGGTSISYLYLFRLLAQRGENVLCPVPTYPLFDDIAKVAGVGVRHYHLRETGAGWELDPEEVEFQVNRHTRAIVLVSPHNPTGSVVTGDQMEGLAAISRRRRIPIIMDEVFREFSTVAVPRPRDADAFLSITLNGLSKMLSLPAMKIGWIVVEGDGEEQQKLLRALEYMNDCFLPASDYLQLAVPHLFEAGAGVLPRLRDLWLSRRSKYFAWLDDRGLDYVRADAGFYIPVRSRHDGDVAARRLLRHAGLLVHPGEFYKLPPGYLVMTSVQGG